MFQFSRFLAVAFLSVLFMSLQMKHKMNQGWLNYVCRIHYFLVIVLAVITVGCAKHNTCDQYRGISCDFCLLYTHGVSVLRAGETVKIVIPSDRLFINDTPEFVEDYKPILDVVANFIRRFSTITVKVAGYSNEESNHFKTKGESLQTRLTREQAQAVSSYLWCQHINTRLLYGVGKNGLDPIAWSGSPIGRYLNRRVEITFRYYRDSKAWY